MNEIKQFNVTYTLPEIKVDLSTVDQTIGEIIEQYDGWQVSENDIATAKETTAELNKLIKNLNSKRIEIKKVITQPITDFEIQVNEQSKRLQDLVDKIKSQLDEYEAKRKQEQRERIMAFEEYESWMPFLDSWLNKTTKDKDIKDAMNFMKGQFDKDLGIIQTLCEMNNLEIRKYSNSYETSRDLDKVTALIKNDVELIKKVKERDVEEKKEVKQPYVENEQYITRSYVVLAPKSKIELLENYANSIGIDLTTL